MLSLLTNVDFLGVFCPSDINEDHLLIRIESECNLKEYAGRRKDC